MGFRIKISDKLNRKTKKWNSIVLIDFFVSRQEFIQKIFKRTLQGCYKVVWMNNKRASFKKIGPANLKVILINNLYY